MARIRSLHPGISSDESFMQMSMPAKAAWPILWTECDDHGIFEWKPIVLKARIFPADNVDFGAILEELVALDCIKKFEVDGRSYGIVRNFGKFQRPKNPAFRHRLTPELCAYAGIDASKVEDKHLIRTSAPPALPQRSPSATEKSAQMKEEGGRRDLGDRKDDVSRAQSAEAKLRIAITDAFTAARSTTLNPDTARSAVWIAQGYDPEICITVVRDVLSRNPHPKNLSYFDRPIADAHEKRAPPRRLEESEPRIDFGGGVSWPERTVKAQIDHWRRDPGTWPRDRLGPPPGEPGCKLPAKMMEAA